MIRIASLVSSVSRNAGGLFDGVRRLVQCSPEQDVEERVFGMQDEFTDADATAWRPAAVSAFQPTWPRNFGYSPRFLEELLTFEPDLIHTHGIWGYPSVAATVFGRNRHCPYIISTHGMLDPWAVYNSRWKKRIAGRLYEGAHLRGARCLRALCEQEAWSIRRFGLKNDIAIIPNGVDLPTGPPPALPPWQGLIGPEKKVLLFLGRIHPKKGLANLLRAWAGLHKPGSGIHESTEWVLAIAGWSQAGHEAELKQMATEFNIAWTDARAERVDRMSGPGGDNLPVSVVFLGPRFDADKAGCYHFCDAFVLPSVSEGLPMTVLEAWANAKPVVMTPQCNLPVGFSANAALEVLPNAESIADGLRGLLHMSEADRAAMGGRASVLAEARFSWVRMARDMKKVYQSMLGAGSRPDCLADF